MNKNSSQSNDIIPIPGYPPNVGMLLWMLEDTRRRTLETLANISQDAIDWPPPHEKNSIGTLLYHIAAIEAKYLYNDVLQYNYPKEIELLLPNPVREPSGILWIVEEIPIDEHLSRLENIRTCLLKEFKQITTEEFDQPNSSEKSVVSPSWVLHHLIQHESEHRGHIQELRISAEAKLQIKALRSYTEPPESPSSRRVL